MCVIALELCASGGAAVVVVEEERRMQSGECSGGGEYARAARRLAGAANVPNGKNSASSATPSSDF